MILPCNFDWFRIDIKHMTHPWRILFKGTTVSRKCISLYGYSFNCNDFDWFWIWFDLIDRIGAYILYNHIRIIHSSAILNWRKFKIFSCSSVEILKKIKDHGKCFKTLLKILKSIFILKLRFQTINHMNQIP